MVKNECFCIKSTMPPRFTARIICDDAFISSSKFCICLVLPQGVYAVESFAIKSLDHLSAILFNESSASPGRGTTSKKGKFFTLFPVFERLYADQNEMQRNGSHLLA